MSESQRKSVIFISGRFRSGTSMLWNIFNKLPNYCSWYEPLHPNLLKHIQYVKPKQDHVGIDHYWANYTKLVNLDTHHSHTFGQKNLLLEKHQNWVELKNYITYLIENSGNKIPVIQFNRMDLRLSWLKNNFPQSTIITIQREPFPLWLSSRKHLQSQDEKENESHPDAYDLMQWSADLSQAFPMLTAEDGRTSYYRHYFIWKLSTQMAHQHADVKLNLVDDFHLSDNGLKILKTTFNWTEKETETARNCIHKPEKTQNKLNQPNNIQSIEKEINLLFDNLGLTKLYPSSPLESIILEHKSSWNKYPQNFSAQTQELLTALTYQKDEITKLQT